MLLLKTNQKSENILKGEVHINVLIKQGISIFEILPQSRKSYRLNAKIIINISRVY